MFTGRFDHRVPNLDYAPDPVGQEVWKDNGVRKMITDWRIWHIGGFPMSIGCKVGPYLVRN